VEQSNKFYKKNKDDVISWVESYADGVFEFTFDREHIFNLFRDYPWQLTAEQKAIFDRENPFWADFFADRSKQ
jgi:hypothetical protein